MGGEKTTICWPGLPQDVQIQQNIEDLESWVDDGCLASPKRFSTIRYTVLSVYRRLFSLVFAGNLMAFIYVMIQDRKLSIIADAAVANVLALGLARQPVVVNLLFLIFGSISRTAPYSLRRLFAKVYCYGGVHSGCGVASLVWYVGFVVLLTRQYMWSLADSPIVATPAIMVLSYTILVLLLSIIIAAHPIIRMKLHDYFELTHRFCGWMVVLLFWSLLILFSINNAHAIQTSLGRVLVTHPAFWMMIVSTVAVIHPWLLLRRVNVIAEPLSTHAIRLHFDHARIDYVQGLSLSKNPLRDWHSFAAFKDELPTPGSSGMIKQDREFSCLISKAGDWTSATISNPPTHLWKRAVPMYGFGYVMKVFARVILVTTGSGIGPCLSHVGDPDRPAMRVIWQTRGPVKTYGQEIVDLVTQLDPDPCIIDTSVAGKRMDMLPLALRLYKEFQAEAIFVISNPVMTKKLVFDCEARGVPAYGPIFDS